MRLTPSGPRLHPGAALPLLRHGDGQPRLHHATARPWSIPARASTRWRRCRRSREERCTALYGVPTMFIAELDHPGVRALRPVQSLRTGIMAGSPCPIEVMSRVRRRDAHARGHHRLRHDRDLPGQLPDRASTTRSSARVAPSAASTRTSRSRSSTPRAASCRRGTPGELCTRGYSVMLGYWDDPERTAEAIDAGGLDAHRRPRDDGRRGLLQHRRPHQGHGDPRRREHLPARDRGVPLPPPRRSQDVQVLRRARRALSARSSAPGSRLKPGETADRGGDPRLLPRPDRPLQDPALRPLRRRLPDDRHRQGAEVRDARGDGEGARGWSAQRTA